MADNGFHLVVHDSVTSTMDVARDYIQSNPTSSDHVVIQALEQTGGRGRRGNQWSSPKGNLYQSIILKPSLPMQDWGQLSFVIAVALKRCCLDLGVPQDILNLKWPNDVLFDGKKISGILIESTQPFVIIGTGVNIEHCPDDKDKLSHYTNASVEMIRDIFLSHINDIYRMWEDGEFPNLIKEWLEHAYRLEEAIQARLPNIIYEGVFEGVDDNGVLLLRENNGSLRKIHSGEIIHHVPCN